MRLLKNLQVILLSAMLAISPAPNYTTFTSGYAQAGIVSKAAKFAVLRLLVEAVKKGSSEAAEQLVRKARSDPRLIAHLEDAANNLNPKCGRETVGPRQVQCEI